MQYNIKFCFSNKYCNISMYMYDRYKIDPHNDFAKILFYHVYISLQYFIFMLQGLITNS